MIRDDLSSRLVHLTRGDSDEIAATNFLSILGSGMLLGNVGCILGGYKCVCFSEAPIAKLTTILATPNAHGMRYKPFGVMVDKRWLYAQGGRPVIYQSKDEFEELPETHRYRHVTYDPFKPVDFTWEREWRLRTDKLVLEPGAVTLVVPTRRWEERLREEFASKQFTTSLRIGLHGAPISSFPWHFIVLEDLGVEIPIEV